MSKKSLLLILICFASIALLTPLVNSYSQGALLKQAEDYQKKGRYLEALSFYRDIYMNKWSGIFAASVCKGIADIYYEYMGDKDSALLFYTKSLEKLPYDSQKASVFHNIAKIYYEKGELEKSRKFYREIFSLFPDYFKSNNIGKEIKTLERGDQLPEDLLLSADRTFPFHIRVLVAESKEPVEASSEGTMEIVSPGSSFSAKIQTGKSISLSVRGNTVLLDNNTPLNGPVRIKTDSDLCIKINGRSFRGFFQVHSINGQLLVINHVGIEEYLYGVLPREISPSWPEHALNAQAVAARTYALYHMVKRGKELYDVFSTTSSQVYGGRDAEHPATQKAVDLTRGLILSYKNKIILALYHANSGGKTENAENVWGSSLPYLCDTKDKFSVDRPGFKWKKKLPTKVIQERMKQFGLPVESIKDIVPIERSESGRIKKLGISQSDESFFLTGNSFRLIVGPGKVKSCNFEIQKKDGAFIFKGTGYGHGVGMSQWGAYGMARAGYDFRKILAFYYEGTKIKTVKFSGL